MTNHYTDVCEATIESLRQTVERQAAQIEMMREGFTNIMVNTCEKFPGQRILQIMEICNKSLSSAPDQALEQFAATADLAGVILCHAEPIGWCGTNDIGKLIVSKSKIWNFLTTPLYRAWEPK